MKLTYLQSSTVIVEHDGVKVLCDPWLVDGEYYGAWAHYPPYVFNSNDFSDIDYIYISHIHPDHLSQKTLNLLNKNIPVLIHKFPMKYLKKNIENYGYTVTELEHNVRTHLKNGLYINILAADDCDPTVCGALFGCNFDKTRFGTNQIDTMCVIDNNNQVIVNTNDCPFEIANRTAKKVKEIYGKIDLLLVGYSGASAYPHCYEFEEVLKIQEAEKKKQLRLTDTVSYINLFKPKYYLPFAGRFTLAGKLSKLNPYRGEPELEEAYDYLTSHVDREYAGFLLNSKSSFDTETGKSSDPYVRINIQEKSEYVENVLKKRNLDYENELFPEKNEIIALLPKAYERFEEQRKNIQFSSDTLILIAIPENQLLSLSCNGEGFKIIKKEEEPNTKFIKITSDPRLLKRLLSGPKYAHWNNADIGSHMMWKRIPNTYERGIYQCLNFLHC